MTPGTQPMHVRINTIVIDPQPRSYTASGGKIIDKITRQTLISSTCFLLTIQNRLQRYTKIMTYTRMYAIFYRFFLLNGDLDASVELPSLFRFIGRNGSRVAIPNSRNELRIAAKRY